MNNIYLIYTEYINNCIENGKRDTFVVIRYRFFNNFWDLQIIQSLNVSTKNLWCLSEGAIYMGENMRVSI